jgi:DivIVA domain-containing protein
VATPGRPLTASEVETRSFERGAPGYLPSHVDLFLAKAARALVGRDGETLTRWDVLRQRFPLGPRGYATSEVDAFLVRLAAQFPDPGPGRPAGDPAQAPGRLTGRAQARRSTTTTGAEVGRAAPPRRSTVMATCSVPVTGPSSSLVTRPLRRPRPARPGAARPGPTTHSW